MKKVYSTLGLFLTFFALLTLTFNATFLLRVKGVEQSPWEETIAENEEFPFEIHRPQLPEDNAIRATFLVDYRWFSFRLVYNQTAETYSVYSLGQLIVGESSLKDEGELVAANVQGPAVSTDGTYDPLEINNWFTTKTVDDVAVVYYDGVAVLTVFSENMPSEPLKLLSPENKTYNTPDVPLEYVTNQIFYVVAYSLDEQANQTIIGNSVLNELTEGPHSIAIYLEGTSGNITASREVCFTISLAKDETRISATQTESSIITDSTSTSTKTETPDYCTEETEIADTKATNEKNLNEVPLQTSQNTNIPEKNTVVFTGFVSSSLFVAKIGESYLSIIYDLMGILVIVASWFFTGANSEKHER